MNREEYLKGLEKYLRRLPKKDYESAMDYFREYFEEAGEEDAQSVIEELGTPKEAAAEVLKNLLEESSNELMEEEQGQKRRAGRGILIAGLAILAAPIGVPLAVAALALILAAVVVVAAVVLCVCCLSLSLICVGVKLLIRGIVALTVSVPGAMIIGGSGLLALGCSILSALLTVYLAKWLSAGVVAFAGRIIRKRRK